MQMKILFITLLVALLVDYISSGRKLTIRKHICQNDKVVKRKVASFKDSIVPILLIKNINDNPLANTATWNMVKQVYADHDEAKIMLVVTSDTCPATEIALNSSTCHTDHTYPSLFYLNNNYLVSERWTNYHRQTLMESLEVAKNFTPNSENTINFTDELKKSISSYKNKIDLEEANRAAHYSLGTSASNRLLGTEIQSDARASASMNTLDFGRTGQSDQQTNLAQASTNIRLMGMQNQLGTQALISGSTSTSCPPTPTSTKTPETSVGVQAIGSVSPQTLNTMRDEPARPQPAPVETQDQLTTIEQRLQESQNDDGDSTFTPTQYQNTQLIDERRPSKRPKLYDDDSFGSKQLLTSLL